MYDSVKSKTMTPQQLAQYAFETCQWWNMVFTQAKRFIDIHRNDCGQMPWDENASESGILVERLFLISSIHHAIEGIQKIDIELQRKNDTSLNSVIEAIEHVTSIQDIFDLRNMNEHSLDYLIDEGNKQDKYMKTGARWTIIRGDTNEFLLGNVDIDKLLPVMKEQSLYVKEKLKKVFFENIVKK